MRIHEDYERSEMMLITVLNLKTLFELFKNRFLEEVNSQDYFRNSEKDVFCRRGRKENAKEWWNELSRV